jgi:hypothetical protein
MTQLDQDLIRQARRAPAKNEVSLDDRIAMNVLWRDGVRLRVLMKIFGRAKNTIYYSCLTGDAPSYRYAKAREINDLVEEMGVDEARKRYVTQEMIRIVNEENAGIVAERR